MSNTKMLPLTRLAIRLIPGRMQTFADQLVFDHVQGGPEVLLGWLETQLGLPQMDVHRAASVMQYADALAKVDNSCFGESFSADRWETASALLHRRDELMLCGWDGVRSDGCPRITRDLAEAEKIYAKSFPGEAERLAVIVEALDAGQRLPAHQLLLSEDIQQWPAAWQSALQRLNVEMVTPVSPSAPDGSSLRLAGQILRGQSTEPFNCDASLRVAKARSETVATDFISSALAEEYLTDSGKVARTVVLCEDDLLAVRLDASLQRRGLPTMGASLQTKAHPVLQVLPLALELCWDPVDPQSLSAYSMDGKLSASKLVTIGDRFADWVSQRYPEATWRVEIPATTACSSGGSWNGTLDLLLELPSGEVVVIDHKSAPIRRSSCEAKAQQYAAQLDAYDEMLVELGQAVAACWIHFPLAGVVAELQSTTG